tara:strand:- start:325 stop:447 length:123 start_codon:yes stop_codon:yes gene_type:complete
VLVVLVVLQAMVLVVTVVQVALHHSVLIVLQLVDMEVLTK